MTKKPNKHVRELAEALRRQTTMTEKIKTNHDYFMEAEKAHMASILRLMELEYRVQLARVNRDNNKRLYERDAAIVIEREKELATMEEAHRQMKHRVIQSARAVVVEKVNNGI